MLRTGFPINEWKLQLLQHHINILGVLLCNSRFQLGNKALGKLLRMALPRSCKKFMALLGRLDFAAQFVSDYRRQVKPLNLLLKGSGGGKWEAQHTAVLNELAELVSKRICLGLV